MIDHSNCKITHVSAHRVGNKINGETLHTSAEPADISDSRLRDTLVKYFVGHFHTPELFGFTFSNGDFKQNPVYNYARSVFASKDLFHEHSVNMAKHLFETSQHPNIKSGDFYMAYFKDLQTADGVSDAIGLFKAENKDTFLRLSDDHELSCEDGINTNKLDKGCLILDTEAEDGFQVYIVDKANKSSEAQFWKEHFLNLKPKADNFHFTNNFLSLTKQFVTKELTENFEVSKADQADLLNKSVTYFKENEHFDEKTFAAEVFQDPGVISSFQQFKTDYQEKREIELADGFEISAPAVKKQSRVFKSVLKLDKNFHVYIHGDRNLIEQGFDPVSGKKFYKIFFDEET